MKSFELRFGALLVLVSLLILGGVTAQGTCTRATCPEGAVRVFFREPNCAGEPEFIPLRYLHNPLNACIGYGARYVSNNVTSEGFEEYFGTSPTCSPADTTTTFTLQLIPFFVCSKHQVQLPHLSGMLLPSVNSTYEAPQNLSIDGALHPNLDTSHNYDYCPSANNCDKPGFIAHLWVSEHNQQCEPTRSTAYYNLLHNRTCYSSDEKYESFECAGPNTRVKKSYHGRGCERVFHIVTEQRVCSSESPNSIYCSARPFSPPTSTTPAEEPVIAPEEPGIAPMTVPVEESVPEPIGLPTPSYAPPDAIQIPTNPPNVDPTKVEPTSTSNVLLTSSVPLIAFISSALCTISLF